MTPREREVLDFIRTYQATNGGISPSLSEISVGIGLSGTTRGTVHEKVVSLERQGFITREAGRQRSISIIDRATDLSRFTTVELAAEVARRSAVALCTTCDHRLDDRTVRACAVALCPHAARSAA